MLHLTLVFLGSTSPSRVPAWNDALSEVAQRHVAFPVETGDAGGRVGGRRGGVAWLRLSRGAHEVAQLALDIDRAIGSNVFTERTAPRPHLTVARHVSADALDDLRRVADETQISWRADRIVLFRSHTRASGSVYEVLTSVALRP